MKKRWVFTGVTALLAVFFLGCVLAVGKSTQWFGFQEMAAPSLEEWQYDYQTTWDPSASSVDGLTISWSNGPVTVCAGQGSLITITESSSRPLEEEERMKISESGGALKIQWDHSPLPLGVFQNLEKQLRVEVPQEIASQLEEFTCGNVWGTISVDGLSAQQIQVTSAAGDLNLNGLQGEEARVSSVSGDIKLAMGTVGTLMARTDSGWLQGYEMQVKECHLSNVTGDLDYRGSGDSVFVDMVSGAVRMELSACPREGEFQSVSGRISLTVPDNDGFEAECSSMSGHFSSEFPGMGEGGSLRYGLGGPKLRFATTSGDVAVRRG